MEIYTCLNTGNELYTNASGGPTRQTFDMSEFGAASNTVTDNEGNEIPIMEVFETRETAEGCTVDFGGDDQDDDGDDDEKKLDYFWQMPDMENEVTATVKPKIKDPKSGKNMPGSKAFTAAYYKKYCKHVMAAMEKRAEKGKSHIAKADLQAALGLVLKFVKKNAKELMFYGPVDFDPADDPLPSLVFITWGEKAFVHIIRCCAIATKA